MTRHRLSFTLGTLILGLVFLLLFPQLTLAHAYVVQSTPAANAEMDQPPQQITIEFNEAVQSAFYSLQVSNENGRRVDLDQARIDPGNPAVLENDLAAGLPNGSYLISWKVLSGDGHPIQGTIPFQVGPAGAAGGTGTPQPAAEANAVQPQLVADRWLLYAGLAVLLGALAFPLYVYPPGRRADGQDNMRGWTPLPRTGPLLWSAYGVMAAALVCSLPLQAAWDAGVPLLAAIKPAVLADTLQHTAFGTVWLIQTVLALLLSVLLIAVMDRDVSARMRTLCAHAAVALVLGIMLAQASSGHAAAAAWKGLAIAMDFVHLAAASFWIGALAVMAIGLPAAVRSLEGLQRKQAYARAIRSFGGWGMYAVALLAATGVYGSIIYLPAWSSLWSSTYGLVLIAKTLLMLAMLGFAARQFRAGRQSAAPDRDKTSSPGGKSIWWEFGIGAAILLLAALLTHLSPPHPEPPGPYAVTQKTDQGYQVKLMISPGQVGRNRFEVQILDPQEQAVSGIQQVTLTLRHTEMDMGTEEIVMPYAEGKPFESSGIFSMLGEFEVKVHALTQSLDAIDSTFTVQVSPPDS
ncbi:copper resistance protein CopC [Paenibacillus sp. JX-17]|uniref:Copper resistance protein CopC n=1 Tax=Paenibacillus lacisoli TaxID=3064525 RepID=A0ABT9CC09_9BACL|nr:copper resistance protein CopC [Paenibacillus sp. JX-17]MDO7906800.1 copper resistance protein CopC [Paenibacillus sp. JX-17]